MTEASDSFWTDETSVVFTSFWGWSPDTWGTLGWTSQARRDNLLAELSDPFIGVIYVTGSTKRPGDPKLKGKIAGFMLLSHEKGDRDQFTHPTHHNLEPEKWRHSVRALRAFSFLPEHLLVAKEFLPEVSTAGQPIASHGKVLLDREKIAQLQAVPWQEVDCYQSIQSPGSAGEASSGRGYVQAGPAAAEEYTVSASAAELPRQLYVLRLNGDLNAYLGQPAAGQEIYKIGVAASPEARRQSFQKAMPQGAFYWTVNRESGRKRSFAFNAAVAGENAMKRHLAATAEHLGGEFYLARPEVLDEAWRRALEVAARSGDG